MTTSTLTLTDFLLERIVEDEAVARKWRGSRGCCAACGTSNEASTLAECEARRRIVALHPNNEGDEPTGSCGTCTDRDYVGLVDDEWPCPTLLALASIYVDHPDFREEWRP